MNQFVNEYCYNDEVIAESLSAWSKESGRSKRTMRNTLFLMVLAIVLMIVTRSVYYIVVVIVAAFSLLYLRVNGDKKLIKMEQKQSRQRFGDEPPTFTITLGEDIHTKTPVGEQHIPYSELDKIISTDHLIVLLLKRNMTIALRRDGFLEGSAEDCVSFLYEKKAGSSK